jgi:O-antigen/teichoic acid export membrane protein
VDLYIKYQENMLNLIGFILPALIDLINRKIKDTDLRYWVSILVCMVVAVPIGGLQSNWYMGISANEIVEIWAVQSLALFGMSQIAYKQVWEDSDVRVDLGLNAKVQ